MVDQGSWKKSPRPAGGTARYTDLSTGREHRAAAEHRAGHEAAVMLKFCGARGSCHGFKLTCCKIMHHIVKGDWHAVREEFGMAIVSAMITAALCVIQ